MLIHPAITVASNSYHSVLQSNNVISEQETTKSRRYYRLGPHANALVSLDGGMNYGANAKPVFLDDGTIRTWRRLHQQNGIEELAMRTFLANARGSAAV